MPRAITALLVHIGPLGAALEAAFPLAAIAAQESIRQATIAERLASDTALANEEYQVQLRGNAQLIAALDKGGNDHNKQLQALHQKAEELTLQHQNVLAGLSEKTAVEQYKKDLTDLSNPSGRRSTPHSKGPTSGSRP